MRERKSGIGFAELLTIAFIVLRLCGIISWSWEWVLSPIWISLSIAVALIIGACLVDRIKDKMIQKKIQKSSTE